MIEASSAVSGRGQSASGLRPASAFVLISLVLVIATFRAAYIAFAGVGEQPDSSRDLVAPWPRFEITDRSGLPMAFSVECYDLTISPQAMWRSHTPERIASALAEVLGVEDSLGLLEQMMPAELADDAQHVAGETGWLTVSEPRLLRFDDSAADRVESWLDRGTLEEEPVAPLRGFELHEFAPGEWTLAWRPLEVLCLANRTEHMGESSARRPDLWTGRLLRDLARLANPEALARFESDHQDLDSAKRRGLLRDAIWAELLPTTFRVVARRLGSNDAFMVKELLRSEAVSPFQVQLRPVLDRRHPVRPTGTPTIVELRASEDLVADPIADSIADQVQRPGDGFQIVGYWGVLGPEDALKRARFERDRIPYLLDWFGPEDPVERRAWNLQTEWRPWSGIELLSHNLLTDPIWQQRLVVKPRGHTSRVRHVSPDRRPSWSGRRIPDYFIAGWEAADVPRVESTIDAELQASVHSQLQGLIESHDAALAQAIVLDVETGDVLAMDGVYRYAVSGFSPLRHVFTPGSTMKAVIMAIALDAGVVDLHGSYKTYQPHGLLLDDGRKPRRIHEAEGAPEEDTVSAHWALAKSVNAVLVQIGLEVPASRLREKLVDLGYANRPGAGLGPEGPGYVPPLQNGTWRRSWAHASVCFGHELSVSLWQHAAAMATIARGGEHRPLRLVRAVEQGDARWELPLEPPRRVLSADACSIVREMLALGAEEGTGRHVASSKQCPEFEYIGTKTGTTEKVPDEVSLHLEWPRQIELAEQGKPWTPAEYKRLKGKRDGRSRIYTSSICAIGRLPGDSREVLVMLVVDEPRSRAKFGSEVAGPTAISILRSAVGIDPRPADERGEDSLAGGASLEGAFNEDGQPWRRR